MAFFDQSRPARPSGFASQFVSLARGEVPVRRAVRSALGDDLDDAVGGLRSIERRRRGSLDDLDGLDVLGIDVVETARAGAAALRGALRGIGIHAHAVDVHDRIGGERQTSDRAHADLRAGAHLSRRRQHHDAGRARADQLLDAARCGSLEDVVRVDAFDDVADGSPFDSAAGTGDDDLIELDGALREREVGGSGAPAATVTTRSFGA